MSSPEDNRVSWEQVDTCLTRLACDVMVGPPAIEPLRMQAFALATLVEGTGPAGAPIADRVRRYALELSPETVNAVVEAISACVRDLAPDGGSGDRPAPAASATACAVAPVEQSGTAGVGESDEDELAAYTADPELGGMFVAEALDHLGTIESVVLLLESSPGDVKLLNDVFRPFHTVKGNAGALGITSVQAVAHKVESLLDRARSGKHAMSPDDFDVVLKAVDLLTVMIQELPGRVAGQPGADLSAARRDLLLGIDTLMATGAAEGAPGGAEAEPVAARPAAVVDGGEPAPPGPAGSRARRDDAQSTVKVDTRKLDNLVDMVGELVIAQSILAQDPILRQSSGERVGRQLGQLKRITNELQRTSMSMRMVPIRQTFQKMARLVRDLSKRAGKSVDLTLTGEDTELDRKVVEDINDPLMHMVRNSVDHGVETVEVRRAAGKGVPARLRLSAFHQAGHIVIEIADDGAGLATERILAKAQAQGLVAADAALSDEEIHQLIFQPGFSTAETVTEISGRGVGMDVVRRNIEALRGRVEICTARGQGTTFTIRLPLTLAIVDGILLGVGAERFVIPTFAVRESLRPAPGQVHAVQGQPCVIQVRERLIPLLHMSEAFGVTGGCGDLQQSTVVVIEDGGRPLALVVDALLGKQEVVIKALGETFGHVRGVSGGAILGDGRIGLILDAGGLLDLATARPLRRAA